VPLRKIEEQTRATYQLAYAPQGEPDGKLHSTRIVVRREGIEVRAQEGYLWMTDEQRRERETLSAFAAPEMFRAIPVSLLVRTYLEEDAKPMVELAIAVSRSSVLLLPGEGGAPSTWRRGPAAIHRREGGEALQPQRQGAAAGKEDAGAGDLTLLVRHVVPPAITMRWSSSGISVPANWERPGCR